MRRIWLEGKLSASQIATQFGLSRNAVLGKVYRLGLIGTRKPNQHPSYRKRAASKPASKPQPKPTPAAWPVHDEPLTMQDFLALTIMELKPTQCHFPRGEAVPYEFCGQPIREGSSYCEYHHDLSRSYTPPAMRRPPYLGRAASQ